MSDDSLRLYYILFKVSTEQRLEAQEVTPPFALRLHMHAWWFVFSVCMRCERGAGCLSGSSSGHASAVLACTAGTESCAGKCSGCMHPPTTPCWLQHGLARIWPLAGTHPPIHPSMVAHRLTSRQHKLALEQQLSTGMAPRTQKKTKNREPAEELEAGIHSKVISQ